MRDGNLFLSLAFPPAPGVNTGKSPIGDVTTPSLGQHRPPTFVVVRGAVAPGTARSPGGSLPNVAPLAFSVGLGCLLVACAADLDAVAGATGCAPRVNNVPRPAAAVDLGPDEAVPPLVEPRVKAGNPLVLFPVCHLPPP